MKNANLSLVITLKSDHLNEMNSLCDYRFSVIIQGQEHEKKRCLQSYINKQETEYVRAAKGRDGTALSKSPKVQLRPSDDLVSSPGEREPTPSRYFYSLSLSD